MPFESCRLAENDNAEIVITRRGHLNFSCASGRVDVASHVLMVVANLLEFSGMKFIERVVQFWWFEAAAVPGLRSASRKPRSASRAKEDRGRVKSRRPVDLQYGQ